jgi:DNA-binding MarR family transcriptional regulator
MKSMTLVARKSYFGVEAQQMRDATARVLTRLQKLPGDRDSVRLDALVEDFRVSAATSRRMIDEMVRRGLLERRDGRGLEFAVTEKFRSYAEAQIIEPLPRARAKMLLNHVADLAWQFNRTAVGNKYEIDALAVFGAYMNLEPELAEVTIAVTGRRRAPATRPLAGRATQALQGHEQIRELIEGQSSHLRAQFFQAIEDIPRPFSVIFKSSG